MDNKDPRACIPQVEALLAAVELQPYFKRLTRPLAALIIAEALSDFRKELKPGSSCEAVREEALQRSEAALIAAERKRLGKLLNATGVVLHTNLGRSPLPFPAWSRIEAINTGYSNLEFNLETGERGSRGGLVLELLRLFSGAEAGLAVNNNAAAILLALSALASGREVIVSRGEAVQIGGGFRIPDILALSGARLVEVGTTNITTIDDYLKALRPTTALVLVVHSSNFALRGFTERPVLSRLAKALPPGLPLIVDQGSGATVENLPGEASVQSLIRAGASLVCFSGDKILGGPQAGLVVGKAELVRQLSVHPLMRTFRPGKTILSILEAVLIERLGEDGAANPTTAVERAQARAAAPGLASLKAFGRKILRSLPGDRAKLVSSKATIGGGSSPDEFLPSIAISLVPLRSADRLVKILRFGSLPVIARIEKDAVIMDLLTLADEDPSLVSSLIRDALALEQAR